MRNLLSHSIKLLPIAAAVAGVLSASSAQAAYIETGDVEPLTNPSTWTTGSGSGITDYIGNTANGSLTVNAGSSLNSYAIDLGATSGVTGTLNLDGSGTTWLDQNGISNIGDGGAGIVNITNGAQATLSSSANLGSGSNGIVIGNGSNGVVNVSGAGSLFNVGQSLIGYSGGTGLINVSNGGTYDSEANSETAFTFVVGDSTGGGTIDVSGTGSTWNYNGINGGIYQGLQTGDVSTISLSNGGIANINASIYMGYGGGTAYIDLSSGATMNIKNTFNAGYNYGTAYVSIDGAGTTWNGSGGSFDVASTSFATGYVAVTNGALVNETGNTVIGYNSGNHGFLNVDGSGTQFKTSGELYVGYLGTGVVSISDGASSTSASGIIDSTSTLISDVGTGSSIKATGALTNNGTLQVVAGAGISTGTYTPITAGSWAGTGAVQALGGEWQSSNHTDTVVAASNTTAGVSDTIDTSVTQRILVTSASDGAEVGAGFLGTSASTSVTFGATKIGGAELSALQSSLAGSQALLSGWDFTSSGYGSASPVYLSFYVGSGFNYNQFLIWQFNGSTWGQYKPTDLAYSNGFVSFTANNLDSYAVAAAVPLPGAAWLFGGALAGLGVFGRRKPVFSA
ncbi:MAG: hypothetical protein ABSB19_14115 [Methylomonas sp.]